MSPSQLDPTFRKLCNFRSKETAPPGFQIRSCRRNGSGWLVSVSSRWKMEPLDSSLGSTKLSFLRWGTWRRSVVSVSVSLTKTTFTVWRLLHVASFCCEFENFRLILLTFKLEWVLSVRRMARGSGKQNGDPPVFEKRGEDYFFIKYFVELFTCNQFVMVLLQSVSCIGKLYYYWMFIGSLGW